MRKTIIVLLGLALAAVAMGAADQSILTGDKKSMVVVGYSTSYQWPGVLQKMLDEHSGQKGLYTVHNAAVSGSPVAKWLGLTKASDRKKTFDKMVQAFFEPGERLEGAPKPTLAFFQQSLQWVYGNHTQGIRAANDAERIEQGADTFLKLAEQIRALGVDAVYIATHIYKHPMEPEIENEKYALQALFKRGKAFIRPGPELCAPTKAVYPKGFQEDKLHPNEIGARIMAIGWYKVLAGDEANASIIEKANSGAFDVPSRRSSRGRGQAASFDERDKDRSGDLTPNEFPENVRKRFGRIDANDDGRVSRAEYNAYRARGRSRESSR